MGIVVTNRIMKILSVSLVMLVIMLTPAVGCGVSMQNHNKNINKENSAHLNKLDKLFLFQKEINHKKSLETIKKIKKEWKPSPKQSTIKKQPKIHSTKPMPKIPIKNNITNKTNSITNVTNTNQTNNNLNDTNQTTNKTANKGLTSTDKDFLLMGGGVILGGGALGAAAFFINTALAADAAAVSISTFGSAASAAAAEAAAIAGMSIVAAVPLVLIAVTMITIGVLDLCGVIDLW